jgi:hypothetical protein
MASNIYYSDPVSLSSISGYTGNSQPYSLGGLRSNIYVDLANNLYPASTVSMNLQYFNGLSLSGYTNNLCNYQYNASLVQTGNSLPSSNTSWKVISLNSAGTVCVGCIGNGGSANDGIYIGTGSGATQWTWSARQSNNSLPGASNFWNTVSLNSAGTVCVACIGSASSANSGIYIGTGSGATQWTWSARQSNNSLPGANTSWGEISLNSAGTVCVASIGTGTGANDGIYIGAGSGATQWTWSAVQTGNSLPSANTYWGANSLNSAGTVCVACIGFSGSANSGIYIGTGSGATQWTWSARQSNNSLPGASNDWNAVSLNSAGTVCVACIGTGISGNSGIYIGTGSGATQWTWTARQSNNSLPGASNSWIANSLNSAGTVCVGIIGSDNNAGIYIGRGAGATQWTWSSRQSNNSLPGTSNSWYTASLNSAGTVCAAAITLDATAGVYMLSLPLDYDYNISAAQFGGSSNWYSASFNSAGTVCAVCTHGVSGEVYIGRGSGANQWTWSAAQFGGSSNWNSVSLNSAGTVCAAAANSGSVYIGTGRGATQWTWSAVQFGGSSNWNSVSLNSEGTVCAACVFNSGSIYIGTGSGATQWTWSGAQFGGSSNWNTVSLNSAGTVCAACIFNSGSVYIGTGSGATQWTWSGAQFSGSSNWNISLNSAGTVCAACTFGVAGKLYIGTGLGATQWTWSAAQFGGSSSWYAVALNSVGTVCAACVYGGNVYIGTGSGATQWTWSSGQFGGSSNWQGITLNSAGNVCATVLNNTSVYILQASNTIGA